MKFDVILKIPAMKFKPYFYILFLLIMVTNCNKNDTDNQIIGKWNWVKTIVPYGHSVSTPQTSGFYKQLEFLTNGNLNEYRNDTLINTSTYTIEKSSTSGLSLKSSIITSDFSITRDSLIFNEAYVDGPIISYSRIK